MREQLKKEAEATAIMAAEINTILTEKNADTFAMKSIAFMAMADFIARQDAYINSLNEMLKDALDTIEKLAGHTGWQPIETHPLNEQECLLAIFQKNILYIADRGGWIKGNTHEEWEEVEDGVAVKLWEDQEEGHWWSNHDTIDDPTHWMPLPEQLTKREE